MTGPATSLAGLLQAWVPRQRWFAGKGRVPELSVDGELRLPVPDGSDVRVHVVTARYGDSLAETYQVPLSRRTAPDEQLAPALVGVLHESGAEPVWVYDAPHDPAYVAAWVALLVDGGSAGGRGGVVHAKGVAQPGSRRPRLSGGSRVLSGEQSNTSVVLDGATPVIVKVFRQLHAGENPDVVVQSALARVGSDRVPAPVGWVVGTWTDAAGRDVTGHLAFAQEFLPGTVDAWREATVAAPAGADFTARAADLGRATAQVHASLVEAFGTERVSTSDLERLAGELGERLEWAAAQVPELAPHVPGARALLDAVRRSAAAEVPARQRIHGDYHLGQVLDAPGRGWVLLDFEGEPLRPLAERSRPDLALRDVAGMLRSFDYAAGHAVAGRPHADDDPKAARARTWAQDCRDAFCTGYADVAGRDPREDRVLLDALELDKALYETVYEARNRPTWLSIPLRAVAQLAGADQTSTPTATDDPEAAVPLSKRRKKPPNPPAETPQDAAAAKQDAPAVPPTPATTPAVPVTPAAATPTAATPAAAAPTQGATKSGPRTPERRPVDLAEIERVVRGEHHSPHSVLGPHPHDDAVTLRILRPLASSVVAVLQDGTRVDLEHEHEGVFVAVLPQNEVGDYRVDATYMGDDGTEHTIPSDDPYRFLPTLGEVDLHLIAEGRHEQLWTVLGAHVREYDGPMGTVRGTSFAVWAPNARSMRVVGDFNHWDGTAHPMRALGSSGVWELFVPGIGEGTRYKLEILGSDGVRRHKADPMARATEAPPATASVVTRSSYTWGDGDWLAARSATDPHTGPLSVYEVHLASWRQGLSYRELADQLVEYLVDTGFTHVELLPVAEHPYGPSWGYQVTGYYAPTARFGSPDEFRHLVDRLHQAGIGVILDWVPAHFPKDAFALARFDGQALYEHPDPRRGDQPDWGTHVFDFGRNEVRNFLVANAVYWLEEFHIDALRVDAVASMLYLDYSRNEGEWVPNEFGGRENLEAVQFIQETNATVYRRVPGAMMIAEESTAWPGVTRPTHLGGLGFGLKWNMGWMHDSLSYVQHEPVHRQYHHHQMTFSLMYAWSESYVLPISHDEVVHGKGSLLRKMPGDRWQQLANLRAYLAYMWAHPGKQLLFMGAEIAQESEWADARSLDWWLLDHAAHRGVQSLVRDLNALYKAEPALWSQDHTPEGFRWVDANDAAGNTFSFVRYGADGEQLVCAVNFSGSPHHGYRLGLPAAGRWEEVLNTDAHAYGGSGVGNFGSVQAEPEQWHGLPASASVSLPPLGAVWFRPAAG